MSRRCEPGDRRVVLHRCADAAEAERWADACRSVLKSLDIAGWWKVRITPADQGALLVSADYEPKGTGHGR